MNIPFIKMQGCGNDYVYVDCVKKGGVFGIFTKDKEVSRDIFFGLSCSFVRILNSNYL